MRVIGGAAASAAYNALLYGLPKPENRSGHYTLMMILLYGAGSVGPILIGRSCDLASYKAVFIYGVIIALIYACVIKFVVGPKLSDKAADYS